MTTTTNPPSHYCVIGSDPGDKCGLACVSWDGRKWTVLSATQVTLNTKKGQRLLNEFMDSCKAYNPRGLVMEEPKGFIGSNKFKQYGAYMEQKIGLKVAIGQGMRRGEIRKSAIDRDITVLDTVSTSEVKAAVGNGRADKDQVIKAVFVRTGFEAPSDHMADAIAICIAGIKRLYNEDQLFAAEQLRKAKK